MYLGVEVTPGAFNEGPVTLTPGWGVEIPSLCVPQVSNQLDLLYIYFNDISEGERDLPGLFCAIFEPPGLGGRKSEKSRLPLNAACVCFVLLGTYFGMYSRGIHATPALSRPFFHSGRFRHTLMKFWNCSPTR